MTERPADQRPCRNECIVKGTERNDEPSMMIARHGNYCDRCFSRIKYPLTIVPALSEHVASMINSHGSGDESMVRSGKAEAPLPFNEQAFNDVNSLYETLVYFTRYFAKRLDLQAPAPAMHSWRTMAGHVKGLPANVTPAGARYQAAAMTTWLTGHLAAIFELDDEDDIEGFGECIRYVYNVSARWPMKMRPYYSEMTHYCGGGKIAIYPPEFFAGDPGIVCEGCGRTWTPAAYTVDLEEWRKDQLADRRKNRVTRFLTKKNLTPTSTLGHPAEPAGALGIRHHREAQLIRDAIALAADDIPPAGVLVTHDDGAFSVIISHTVPAGQIRHTYETAGGHIDAPAEPIGAS